MIDYLTIAEVEDPAMARVLALALRAHGFSPREPGDFGLPGLPRMFEATRYPIAVPEDEADDARVLAEALLNDMKR